jgi:hypothetical protein
MSRRNRFNPFRQFSVKNNEATFTPTGTVQPKGSAPPRIPDGLGNTPNGQFGQPVQTKHPYVQDNGGLFGKSINQRNQEHNAWRNPQAIDADIGLPPGIPGGVQAKAGVRVKAAINNTMNVIKLKDSDVLVSNSPQHIVVEFSGLTIRRIATLPAEPTLGQRVKFADMDGSLARVAFYVSGSGMNIDNQSGLYMQSKAMTIEFNGTQWVVDSPAV